LRWVPLLGGLGAATGAIAIGAVVMSTSTITIISTGTPIGTSIVVKLARATGGSTTRNTVEMLPMEIEGRPTNSADVAPVVSAARAALVVPEDPVVSVVRVALVVPESPVALAVRVALVVPESPAVPAALELELGPVAAVALRAKSVTAAHHPGLVPVPRVEDSAAVAETTRAPVAAEAAKAWAAVE